MIFLQSLYGLILAELLGIHLSARAQLRLAQVISVERKHRTLTR